MYFIQSCVEMPSYSLARWSCVITSPVAYCAPGPPKPPGMPVPLIPGSAYCGLLCAAWGGTPPRMGWPHRSQNSVSGGFCAWHTGQTGPLAFTSGLASGGTYSKPLPCLALNTHRPSAA